MCTDMCTDMCADMCLAMCADMCILCIDTCTEPVLLDIADRTHELEQLLAIVPLIVCIEPCHHRLIEPCQPAISTEDALDAA